MRVSLMDPFEDSSSNELVHLSSMSLWMMRLSLSDNLPLLPMMQQVVVT